MNTLPKIQSIDIEHVVAQTIINKGHTVNLKGQSPTTGYMVSVQGKEARIDLRTHTLNELYAEITEYIEAYDMYLHLEGAYLGTWVHDKHLYLDISFHYVSKDRAEISASVNKQIAYFDVANKLEILTPKNQ